jgi:phage shock protein PspC (stress-responsive transcriptional regulator)
MGWLLLGVLFWILCNPIFWVLVFLGVWTCIPSAEDR